MADLTHSRSVRTGASEPEPSGKAKREIKIGAFALSVPALAAGLAFVVAPLFTFAVYSLLTTTLFGAELPATLSNFDRALSSDLVRSMGWNSFVMGFFTAGASLLLGLPIAFWLRYHAGRWQIPVLFLISATMFAGYLVRIYAWRTILGSNGVINSAFESVGLIDRPLEFIVFSRFAVCVALVHIFLPYAVLVLFAGFNAITSAHLEAAQDLGAGASMRWRRVIVPLMAAPIGTVFIFVFILAAGDYVTPQLLGGPDGVSLGVFIQSNVTATGDWPLAAAASMLMLAAFAVCWALIAIILRLTKLDRVTFTT